MKILQTGDWHLSNRGSIAGRYVMDGGVNALLADKVESVRTICSYVEEEDVDLVIVTGDLFDSGNPDNVSIKVAVEAMERLCVQCPVVVVKGNHDGQKGAELANALAPFGRWAREHGLYVAERPEVFSFITNRCPTRVFCLPYPRKSAVTLDSQYKTLSPEELNRFVSFKMEEVVAGFKAQIDHSTMNVFVGHFSIAGGSYSKEQLVPPFDIYVREEFLNGFDVVCLGHLHLPQKHYAGAIARGGFGDEEMSPGFNVIEVLPDAGGWTVLAEKRVAFANARVYRTLNAERILEQIAPLEALPRSTVVRIKGEVTKEQYMLLVRKVKGLGFPFVQYALEIDSPTARSIDDGSLSDEPTLEETIRLWAKGKEGADRFLDKMIVAAREIEIKWRAER